MLKCVLLIFLMFNTLTACSHLSYYTQAIGGQLSVLAHTQSIRAILVDPKASPQLKHQLTEVLKMRAFATQELYLPNNASYTRYADLKRPYAMWSVFATPPFSLEPKRWCFLFVGCVHYVVFFKKESAEELAAKLKAQNYDVYVGGTVAYSTLGWFEDPVFNTMLRQSPPEMAGFIFHELAHQLLYVPGDTTFNESFATAVEEIGVERWLTKYGTPTLRVRYHQMKQQDIEFTKLVLATRDHLQQLYSENLPPPYLRAAKEYTFSRLQNQYQVLKQTRWNGDSAYDNWIKNVNNARLVSVATYQDFVPAFKTLLIQQNDDLIAFYQVTAHLGKLPKVQRQLQLQHLLDQQDAIPIQLSPEASQKYHNSLAKRQEPH